VARRGLRSGTVPHYSHYQCWLPARVASWRICTVWGIGARTRLCEGVPTSGWRHVRVGPGLLVPTFTCGPRLSRRRKLHVRTSKLSEARRRLLVRGGNLPETPPPTEDLSVKPYTGRRQRVLPVMVLTRIHNPHYIESWPSHCQLCQMTPS
jgi:hypothetical protein